MVTQFLLVFVCAAVVNASDPDWESYKTKFNRNFDDPDEETMRHGLFNGIKIVLDLISFLLYLISFPFRTQHLRRV